MAAMTTALTEFADNGNSRTFTTPNHTALKQCKVLQRRHVPSGNQVVAEDVVTVLHGTEDVDGAKLPQNVQVTVSVRRPITGIAADVNAALVIARDIVASDEFTNSVNTQEFLS